jgi:hypothetical protein
VKAPEFIELAFRNHQGCRESSEPDSESPADVVSFEAVRTQASKFDGSRAHSCSLTSMIHLPANLNPVVSGPCMPLGLTSGSTSHGASVSRSFSRAHESRLKPMARLSSTQASANTNLAGIGRPLLPKEEGNVGLTHLWQASFCGCACFNQ